MSKVSKATKKFAQKKAKGTAQFKRKPQHHKKHGQAKGAAAVNGAAGKGGARRPAAAAAAADANAQQAAAGVKPVEEMDLDEFLDGGFEAAAAAAADSSGSDGGDGGSSDEGEGEGDSSGDLDDVNLSDDEDDDDEGGAAADAADAAGSSEEEEGEDEEGDGDDGEAAAVAADNARLSGAVSRHKAQLESLREKDPEFYAYLQAADAELLGFGEGEGDDDSELEEEDDDEDSEEEPAPAAAKGKEAAAAAKKSKQAAAKTAAAAAEGSDDEAAAAEEEEEDEQEGGGAGGSSKGALQVTSALVDGWTQAALDKASLGAMMQLVKAYRVACHYGDTEAEMSSTLAITSGAVFNKVLLFMLKEADGIFRRMLGLSQDASTAAAGAAAGAAGGKPSVLLAEQVTKAQRWRKVEPLVKSYLGNSIHLLSSMTQPAMTAFTLRRLRSSAAFLGPFSHLTKKLMRIGLKLYGSEEAGPRLQALLLVRQMALVLPAPAAQSVLRGAYRSYVSSAKFVSPASLPTLSFMASGFVELSSLDLGVTYQVGFVAIRELAVLLRNALAAKTQDAHKEVYCWQTLMCLELWVKVLAAAAPQGTLQPLVYPTTQLLLGAARLVPTPRYFPIRLRLVRALNRLAQATGVYIPVSPLLLEMVQWSELRKSPHGTAAAPDLLMLLRLNKAQLKTAATQEEVVSQVLELLTEHLAQWATSISFPELSHLPCVALRSFIKGCAVERFRRQAKGLVDALERNGRYVGVARDGVGFAPQDLAAATGFLSSDKERAQAPLAQYARQVLQKAAARLAMRSSATQEVDLGAGGGGGGGSKRKRGRDEDDGSDSEEEEEEEEEGGADAGLLCGDDESDGSDDDAALDAAARRMMRQKEKRLKRSTAAAAAGGGDGGSSDGGEEAGEDQVGVYQLSDEEDDSEDGAGDRRWGVGAGGDDSGSDDDGDDSGSDSEGEGAAAGGGAARGRLGRGGGGAGGRGQQRGRGAGGGGRGQQRGGRGGGKQQQQQQRQGGRGGGGGGGGRGGGGRGGGGGGRGGGGGGRGGGGRGGGSRGGGHRGRGRGRH